jgi:hypothetical protein
VVCGSCLLLSEAHVATVLCVLVTGSTPAAYVSFRKRRPAQGRCRTLAIGACLRGRCVCVPLCARPTQVTLVVCCVSYPVSYHSAPEGRRGSFTATSQHLSPTFAHRRASASTMHEAGDKLIVICWKRMTTEEVDRFRASKRRSSVTRRALVKVCSSTARAPTTCCSARIDAGIPWFMASSCLLDYK